LGSGYSFLAWAEDISEEQALAIEAPLRSRASKRPREREHLSGRARRVGCESMVEYHVSVVGMSSGLSVSHKPHFVKLALLARLERRASVNGHGTSLESVHGLCCRRNVPVSGWDLSAIFDSILGVSVHICCGESWTRLPRQDMLVSSYRTWSTEFDWWHAYASYRGVSQSDASSRVKTGFITACHFALEDALRPPTKSPITFPAGRPKKWCY